jgi:hypothetical protein
VQSVKDKSDRQPVPVRKVEHERAISTRPPRYSATRTKVFSAVLEFEL